MLRGDIATAARNNRTLVAFKNCAPFIKYIAKIGTTIDDTGDLI